MLQKFLPVLVTAASLLSGCGSGNGSAKKIWDDALGNQDKADKARWTVADLAGNWRINCGPSVFMASSAYRSANLQIDPNGSFSYQSTEFSDQNCINAIYETESRGIVNVSDAVDAFRKSIQFSFAAGSATLRSEVYIGAFNQIGTCGSKNWVLNQTQDLTNAVGCLSWHTTETVTSIGLSTDENGKNLLQLFGKGGDISGNTFIKD